MRYLLLLGLLLLAGCGGSESDDDSSTIIDSTPVKMEISSDANNWIMDGERYTYTKTNAQFDVKSFDDYLVINIKGDQHWEGSFSVPAELGKFTEGTYTNLNDSPYRNSANAGVSWSGRARRCHDNATLTVHQVRYSSTQALEEIHLEFELYCSPLGTSGIYGEIIWSANDKTTPPGPQTPPPITLWRADESELPQGENYLYLESDAGEFIGQGKKYLYKGDQISLQLPSNNHLKVRASHHWSGDFITMYNLAKLEVGYYHDLLEYLSHNPAKGGLKWWGQGRACGDAKGWFVVDSQSIINNVLMEISLRFKQQCDGQESALYGQLQWVKP